MCWRRIYLIYIYLLLDQCLFVYYTVGSWVCCNVTWTQLRLERNTLYLYRYSLSPSTRMKVLHLRWIKKKRYWCLLSNWSKCVYMFHHFRVCISHYCLQRALQANSQSRTNPIYHTFTALTLCGQKSIKASFMRDMSVLHSFTFSTLSKLRCQIDLKLVFWCYPDSHFWNFDLWNSTFDTIRTLISNFLFY